MDNEVLLADPSDFSTNFYEGLFEIAPETRALFSDDMTEQRDRLLRELSALIAAATAWRDASSHETLVRRTHALGRRHATYGVTADMYEPVELALMAALRDQIPGFDTEHENAWTKLFGFMSATMLEGSGRPD